VVEDARSRWSRGPTLGLSMLLRRHVAAAGLVLACLVGAVIGAAVVGARGVSAPGPANGGARAPVAASAILAQAGETTTAPPRPVVEGQDSIVQVMAMACDTVTSGSGFFISPYLVLTNAHVVAGDPAPHVIEGESAYPAEPVLFDPNLDIAVLRVAALRGTALPLVDRIAALPLPASIVGYPYGGPLSSDPATVTLHGLARTADIYGQSMTNRDVYVLRGLVRPGDSGGPITDHDGRVVGAIFAGAPNDPSTAYAITSSAIEARLQMDLPLAANVGDGRCIPAVAPFVMDISPESR
jgi:S1-C subfamily serine protease